MTEAIPISATDGNELFQILFIPKQKPPPPADAPSMKAYVSTYPALSQVTRVAADASIFTATLEVDESRASEDWEVSLWHTEGQEWRETPMKPLNDASIQPVSLQAIVNKANLHKLYFATPSAISLPTTFTVKFRKESEQSWKWAKDHQGAPDGSVISTAAIQQEVMSDRLQEYIPDLGSAFQVKVHPSQTPRTTLWSVEAPIEAAEDSNSTIKDVKLGTPWGSFARWFALVRIWVPWLAPRQGKTYFDLDKEAVMCSFLNPKGQHLVLLAISAVDDVMTLFTSVNGAVNLRIRNDSAKESVSRVLVGLGDTFESANAAVMYHARDIISSVQTKIGEQQRELEALKTGDEKTKLWAENWYDGLTYCTWNALGQQLSEEKVIKTAETLAQNNINITNFIIDDNWQAIDYRGNGQFQHGWIEFEAERNQFPKGLKHTVSQIREKLPSVQHVAVWHAILGYWGGISPDGKIAKSYKTTEVLREDAERRNLPLGGKLTVVDKEDVNKFYDDFYSFLSSCGIDAVKTDAQFMLDTFVPAKARREIIPAYLDAWTMASLRHFSVKAISCMSQTPQILFHSQLPQTTPPFLVRNSDDFFPEVPTSHPWHIWTNAHNALFTQHLNVIPDWDMFQTVHDYSGFHAAARCVSGGPIYITDVPGQHDFDLINQMTGMTVRGKSVIFRPSVMGKSLDQYNGYDDDALLLVGTYHGAAVTGTGIIGIFNVSQRPLSELIPLSKFPGVVEAQYYITRAHSSGIVSKPLQVVDQSALIDISLGVRGYDIISAYPLRGFVVEAKSETTWIANLGLLGKMTGAAAIVDNTITKLENGRIFIDTSIKALGVVGIYISTLPKSSIENNFIITILGKVLPIQTIAVSKVSPYVLEIDVERAWKELELKSGWSNEVELKIYVSPTA